MPEIPRTILLTGATGFLGSHVADALVAEGWTVRCTVRKTSNPRWIESLPVERVTADVRSAEALAVALDGIDVVVHSAGLTRAKSDADYQRVNAEGTQALALGAVDAGVRRFVLVSSLAARGPDRRASD
ncbi:MAG: NAD(P)H-binding protein, partial [Gemmatimonadetes bacterium]|nr:NAD(P)H-binding protein [Gemmatimonadota bacterium]